MVVVFATLGFTPGLVLAPLHEHPAKRLVVFYGATAKPDDRRQRNACLAKVRRHCRRHRIELDEIELDDGFDFEEANLAFAEAYGEHGPEVIMNASSGPRPMIMAAAVFCMLHRVPLVYHDEYEAATGRRVPVEIVSNLLRQPRTKKSILLNLRGEDKGVSVGALAARLNVSHPTMVQHLKELRIDGLIESQAVGKSTLVRATPIVNGVAKEALQ